MSHGRSRSRSASTPSELRRVLINLVSNALEAMPEGGRAGDRASPSEAGCARIDVRDTGVGALATRRARKLFEPYFTTRSHGTGLGLAIARRAVEEMGGAIGLEPRSDGPGSVATVDLPAGRDRPTRDVRPGMRRHES